jgi:hypothetical protein
MPLTVVRRIGTMGSKVRVVEQAVPNRRAGVTVKVGGVKPSVKIRVLKETVGAVASAEVAGPGARSLPESAQENTARLQSPNTKRLAMRFIPETALGRVALSPNG